jgi:hypothetical protein
MVWFMSIRLPNRNKWPKKKGSGKEVIKEKKLNLCTKYP